MIGFIVSGALPLMLLLSPGTQGYTYERGKVNGNDGAYPCPGLYCGRIPLGGEDEGLLGPCGQCPRGWRVFNNTHSICQKCEEAPELYDWFYLAFMSLFVLVLHWIFIDTAAKRRKLTREVLFTHLCAALEVGLSSGLSLLWAEPFGSFSLVSCHYQHLGDWYTALHNPNPNYEETIHCTTEAIYPLYTLIFVFYVLCLAFMLLLRPLLRSSGALLCCRGGKKRRANAGGTGIYAALYFLPILALLHAIFGGLIYVSFPYIVVILSVISSASHFAFKLDQSPKALFLGCFTDPRNGLILLGHWSIHPFGILAITPLQDPALHASLIPLVPLPAFFYILPAKFTDPANFDDSRR
uniref:JNK1-associated membrane protein n=1 Tax=Caligus rogercresseyi TaxID=217165 RepID=C1BME2_CALRO|nr:JNK1-associated membrane protein [Caligus rogercresseyi]